MIPRCGKEPKKSTEQRNAAVRLPDFALRGCPELPYSRDQNQDNRKVDNKCHSPMDFIYGLLETLHSGTANLHRKDKKAAVCLLADPAAISVKYARLLGLMRVFL
jgi:hypothetical protein